MTPEQQQALLELVSTDALYLEIQNRFDHVIISGTKSRPTPETPQNRITSYRYKGDPRICQGLACDIIARCQHSVLEHEENIASDEL